MKRAIAGILILVGMWAMWRNDKKPHLHPAPRGKASDIAVTGRLEPVTTGSPYWYTDKLSGAQFCAEVIESRVEYLPCTGTENFVRREQF